MANNILEPFYLDLIQRETAHREQLRQQQLEQELQLTSNPLPGDYEPGSEVPRGFTEPCSSPRRGEAVPRRPIEAQNDDVNPSYHSPQCTICNHPEREDIDRAILHWHSPTAIAYEFDLGDRRIVYRHAHALGLFRRRAEQSRHALGFLIEQAQAIVPTADAIIRAVRALSCIDDHGQWHEPRKEVIITHRHEQVSPPNNESDSTNAPPRGPRRTTRSRGQVKGTHASAPPLPSAQQITSPSSGTQGGRIADGKPSSHSPLVTSRRGENWSTRLLSKFRRKPNRINKTRKIGRHTFGMFGKRRRPAFHRPEREVL